MALRNIILFFPFAFAVSSAAGGPTVAENTPATAQKNGAAAIATQIAHAYDRLEAPPPELFADKIEVWHLPGTQRAPAYVTREQFRARALAEVITLKKAAKDFHIEVSETRPGANGFTLSVVYSGTRSSGEKFSSPISIRCDVMHGVVTRWETTEDPAEHEMLGEIAKEGGLGPRQM